MSYYIRVKNVNNIRIAKVQPRVLLSICLIFCHVQPGVACKSVAYKQACISQGVQLAGKQEGKLSCQEIYFC